MVDVPLPTWFCRLTTRYELIVTHFNNDGGMVNRYIVVKNTSFYLLSSKSVEHFFPYLLNYHNIPSSFAGVSVLRCAVISSTQSSIIWNNQSFHCKMKTGMGQRLAVSMCSGWKKSTSTLFRIDGTVLMIFPTDDVNFSILVAELLKKCGMTRY